MLNGAIYLFSGRGGPAMDAVDEDGSLWVYTPNTSSWALTPRTSPTPAPRSYHAMTSDGISKLYLHAGCPATGRLSDLWAYDTDTSTWSELPPAPGPARGGTSLAFAMGKLFRAGGFDGEAEQGGAVDVYNPVTRTWSTIFFAQGREGPEARSVAALVAGTLRGRGVLVCLFGERDPSALGHAGAGKMLGDVWVFELGGEVWSRVGAAGEAPEPRGWFGSGVLACEGGDDAYDVHGGLAGDNERLGDVWVLRIE
ncbi:hypothetical protein IMZ48_00775 [Candidatus Bathyarchaeota archaeon]|nr:hypothetical protein [Candidatus Bathyarchaeota archaeon]